jgi:hypothetical protein
LCIALIAAVAIAGDVSAQLETSVWSNSTQPSNANAPDASAVELGVKFRTTVDGFITGVRFYKGPGNTGTHIANLWTTTGQRLATAQFQNETASGWQQVHFAAPVAITANTTYVVSYFAPQGRYAYDRNFFANSGLSSGRIYLLRDGESGGNGVYVYAASSSFPSNSFDATNYWVDPLFEAGPDTIPPTVRSVSPTAGATNVGVSTSVTVVFDEPMDPASVNESTVVLQDASNAAVQAVVTYQAAQYTATLTPTGGLITGATYTARVRGGASGQRVTDVAGNALASTVSWSFTTTAPRNCSSNPIVEENCRPGNPQSEWDVVGAGDESIVGFATSMSVNKGELIRFKVNTDATSYRIDVYRLGYYDGLGARRVITLLPSATLPQTQPECLSDPSTGLVDCGNWSVSASWTVPATAVSGVYLARLVRSDTSGASHIPFIVRDDAGQADILVQTSDTTWQAYNTYGDNSLYQGGPIGRAFKVSYNRPMVTRATLPQKYLFNAEYPMIRWLEANGYSVSYVTGIDVDRRESLLLGHKLFMSSGHDEYWSGTQRTNVEAARDQGVNLTFFSGNEVFWKTRWEPSIDGSGTPHRTLVCYKETHSGAKIDPDPAWTGTWRDARFSPPYDGGRPENGLTGTIFVINADGTTFMRVPAADGRMRFWRNTSIATLPDGGTATLPFGTLGYEWDEDADNGFRPAGLIRLSTTVSQGLKIQDNGSEYAQGNATHSLTLYRASSGALVFGAGTIQWAWGLDSVHDRSGGAPDPRMQQATVNLFADMGAQPGSLQSGLVPAVASTDHSAPTSTITTPAPGGSAQVGSLMTVAGTAVDAGGGVVGGVEVSVDGGTTWRRANGRATWSYSWTPTVAGPVTLRSRAADDSGNLETPGPGRLLNVGNTGLACPCGIWNSAAIPLEPASTDSAAVELGVKFKSSASGYVFGIRFYKSVTNTGTHTGSLWSATGTRLATVTFTNETASGWQEARFATPVAIAANTVYVASYFSPHGNWYGDRDYFANSGITNGTLYLLRDGESGGNGVYASTPGQFPNNSFQSTNYWADVIFDTQPPPNVLPVLTNPGPQNGAVGTPVNLQLAASDANGDSLSYSASGLPAGLTLNSTTGLISGTPTTVGGGTVTVTVNDGRGGSDSESFNWTITPPNVAPVLSAPAAQSGSVGTAVSLQLAATDGNGDPLTYSASGLPAGLTVGTTTGLISGTPQTVGSGPVTVTVNDGRGGSDSETFTWTVFVNTGQSCPCTIWNPTVIPSGPPSTDSAAVELGVRFRSSVNGYITGIRFYKGVSSTGTHTGSLWSATGTRLATVTFTNESASGWQEARFAIPVAITANTVYVASYFSPQGNWYGSRDYFATTGVWSGPLYVLRDGEGGNGVYAYGAVQFPNSSYQATNYWADLIFEINPPPNATPVLTAPGAQNGAVGTAVNLQLLASDADGDTLSYSASGLPAGLTVNSTTGLISGTPTTVGSGPVTVTVNDGRGGSDSENFTWTIGATNVAPVLNTPATQNGLVGTTVSLQLAATDGNGDTLSYSASGLPAGLTVAATTGLISGTPTTVGTGPVTVTVNDGRGGIDSETFTWTVLDTGESCPCTIMNATAAPSGPSSPDAAAVALGIKFRSAVNGYITGIRFYKSVASTGTHTGSLWSTTGTRLATVTFTNETPSGWQEARFATPVAITANTVYVASYFSQQGNWFGTRNQFVNAGMASGPLYVLREGELGGNGVYAYGVDQFPNSSYESTYYWVDLVFETELNDPQANADALSDSAMGLPAVLPRH